MPDSLPVGVADPRVGPAFMALAIENGATERLGEASRLFLWSFTGDVPDSLAEHVGAEARRIIPILSRRDSAAWEAAMDDGSSELAHAVARFWLERDPTPDTPLNERLVEHWTRIVEARSLFARHRRSPYGTDDRGVIYVRYGPPDEDIGGTLGGSEVELRVRVTDRLWREQVRLFDPHPDFALWKYTGLNPDEFTYFLFGNLRGTGPFELVTGPHDLVSDHARSIGSRELTPGGVRGQYYLELFYYHDLSVLGGHYSRRFGELSDLWDGYTLRRNLYGSNGKPSPTGSTLLAFSSRYQEEDRRDPPGRPVVRVRTNFDEDSRGVELFVQPVRLLDADNRPNLVIQSLAAPRIIVGGTADGRRAMRARVRDTRHTLVLRDRALNEAGRTAHDAPAANGGIAVFRLFHPRQPIHVSVYATPMGAPVAAFDTLSLVGAGHAYVDKPLSADTARFEMSDLAVGRPIGPNADRIAMERTTPPAAADSVAQWIAGGSPLPFELLPARRMWPGDAMRVYVELYHLRADPEGERHYELGFRLISLDATGNPVNTSEPVTVGIPLEGMGSRVGRTFDIGLGGLEPGLYRLEVVGTDLVANATVVRAREIEIMEVG